MGAVVEIVGASGGVGASTIAAAAAGAWSRATDDVVLAAGFPDDALDVTCAIEHLPGLRWRDLAQLEGNADGAAIASRLPRWEQLPVLSGPGPRITVTVRNEVLRALAGTHGITVVDAGRQPLALSFPSTVCHLRVIVARVGARGLADVRRLVTSIAPSRECVPLLGLVTRGARAHEDIAAHIGATCSLSLLAHLPDSPRVARALERGTAPAEALRGVAQALIARAETKLDRQRLGAVTATAPAVASISAIAT